MSGYYEEKDLTTVYYHGDNREEYEKRKEYFTGYQGYNNISPLLNTEELIKMGCCIQRNILFKHSWQAHRGIYLGSKVDYQRPNFSRSIYKYCHLCYTDNPLMYMVENKNRNKLIEEIFGNKKKKEE